MFRLAVLQPPSDLTGPGERFDWLSGALAGIGGRGVDLALLPELFMTGYNRGGNLAAWAEPADGPFARQVAGLARHYGTAIHYGFPERCDGVLYNAAQCLDPEGNRLGGHRKLILPPGFEADHFRPGRGCSVFDYRGVRIGMLICYDIEFPETVRHVAGLGADLMLVPTALGSQWGWVARTVAPARGYENGVFFAYANYCGTENGMSYLGESFISAPDGRELARAGGGSEVLIADIDLSLIDLARGRLPYLTDRLRISLG